ncbi:MAG: serine/threonine protein kinase, partial [Pirellulaceae bacterium]
LIDHPKYEILELIGQGGMGAVFKARHRIMDRLVAIKIIHPRFVENRTAIERFQREAKTVASLRHPNIVTALDAEQVGETHLLVMDYVDGQPLDEAIATQGALSVEQTCEIALQISRGLEHANQHNMVHRDIKPQNVMIASDGMAKILDLGLARIVSEQQDGDGGLTRLTGEHVVLGSPDYIAPEQIDNAKNADIRADIYSLGGTIYAMLCGHAPFPTGSTMDKFACHKMKQPDSVEEKRTDVPQKLLVLLNRMLAKQPSERPQTPAEVSRELEGVVKQLKAGLPVVDVTPQASGGSASPPAIPRDSRPAEKQIYENIHEKRRLANSRWKVWLGVAGAFVALAFLLFVVIPGMFSNPNAPTVVSGQRRVLIVIPNSGFWSPDFSPVRRTLVSSGVQVDVGSSKIGTCTPLSVGGGSPVQATVALSNARADDYDAVVFMGWNIDAFRVEGINGNDVAALISEMQSQRKWVTSLCAGNVVLAEHGALLGKEAASGPHLKSAGALPNQAIWNTRKPVIVSGMVITGRDDSSARLFAETLLGELSK